jgi:leader peptidase (prepilin peptidase)/N-methyltransferase
MIWFPALFISFITGTVIGSFLNVCIHRLPRDESIVNPPSHCPKCNHRLGPADLVPILSWLLLKRKCRYCGAPISGRYAMVEGITGLLFAYAVWHYRLTPAHIPFAWVIMAGLIIVFFADLETFLVPDQAVWAIGLAGVGLNVLQLVQGEQSPLTIPVGTAHWTGHIPVPLSIPGAVFGGGVLALIRWVFTKIYKREAMGLGDVKIAAAVGTYAVPWAPFLMFFLIGVFAGASAGVAGMALKKVRLRQEIPWGPSLALAGLIALLWMPTLMRGLEWWLSHATLE